MNSSVFLLSIGLTLSAYAASRVINTRLPSPLTNPVILTTPCVIVALLWGEVDYSTYRQGTELITMPLAWTIVALAVPLYKHRAAVLGCAPAAITGMVCGGLATAVVAVALARLIGLQPDIACAMGIKSATAPIALQIAPIVGADASISAVLAISTGMCGAMIGPRILNICSIRHPICRGLAYGSISHGIGTVQATAEGELQGAVSAAAMGFSALMVALAVPRLLPFLI